MKKGNRILSGRLILCVVLFATASWAYAQEEYPNKPVRIVVPWGPGSTTDVISRIISEPLSRCLKVNVLLDYKAGGSGMIGSDTVAKGKPDGYTILCGTVGNIISGPITTPETAPYDPLKDFIPLVYLGEAPTVLMVSSQFPAKTFEEFLDYAKKNPGKLNCGTMGVGTATHFVPELISINAGIKIVHVPYKEGGQVVTAILGGHIDLGSVGASVAMPHVKTGKLRLLVATVKVPDAPDVPTLKEKGFGQASIGIWIGYLVHSRTPQKIQNKLIAALTEAAKDPEIHKKLEKAGFVADYKGPKEFSDFLRWQYDTISKTAKVLNLTK